MGPQDANPAPALPSLTVRTQDTRGVQVPSSLATAEVTPEHTQTQPGTLTLADTISDPAESFPNHSRPGVLTGRLTRANA